MATVHAQVYVPFEQRWSGTLPGDLFMLANTVVTCQSPTGTPSACGVKNDNQVMVNAKLPSDSADATIVNSSSSDLTVASLPAGASVVKAELYWGGIVASASGAPSPAPASTPVKMAIPGGAYNDISPDACALSAEMNTFGSGNHFLYQCRVDVTARVQAGGVGTYQVANVPVHVGVVNRFAGWSIVVVVRKPGGTLRNFTINDGMAVIRNVTGATSLTIPISGFTTPLSGPVAAQVGVVAYDGDKTATDAFSFQGAGSPSVALSDACNPANDEFNSSICHLGSAVTTRSTVNSNLNDTLGFDADIIQLDNPGNANLGNGVTSAAVTASTPSEGYPLGLVTTAIDVYQPAFEGVGVKTVTNQTHPGLPAGYAYPGDVLRYQVRADNIGQDNAIGVVLDDAIPSGTTYLADSLVVVSGANAGAKTDVAGDDQAEFDAGSGSVRFRVGVGADAASGGLIRCPTCIGSEATSSVVQFDVTVNAGTPPGTLVRNTAGIHFEGQTSGQTYDTDTNEVDTVVVAPAIGVAKQAGILIDNGDGTFTVPLTFTVKNLSPTATGAAGALTDVQVSDDLAATFPAPISFTVGAVTATGSLSANSAFDGVTQTELLVAASSTLAAGATETVSVSVTFDPHGQAGPFLNQAFASAHDVSGDTVTDTSNNGTDPDPNGDGNPEGPGESEPTPIAGPSADLDLAKSVDVAMPLVGSQVNYTLTVTNAGPDSAGGITVEDVLPSGLVFVSSGGDGSYDAGTGVWTVGALASGASASLTITATVAAGGNYLNTAEIATTNVVDPDSTPGNGDPSEDDYASVGIAPRPVADVSIVKNGPATVSSGAVISYTLTIANAGPSAADGATYSDTVPASISGVAATCGSASGGAVCAAPAVAGNLVSGTVPVLPAGGSVVITITGTAPVGEATLTNTATVTPPAGATDPDQGNNSSTVDTDVGAAADIAVSKSVDNDTPNVGDDVSFTVTVQNNGPDDATGVVVTDALPAGLIFVSATPSQGAFDDVSGAWTVGALANGVSATLQLVATVDQAGSITNTATRTAGDQDDPDDSNNSGSAMINGQPAADLQVAKVVDSDTPNVGTDVTYTITLTNAGPNDATGVGVSDLLPTGLSFVGATPSQGSYDDASGLWSVGDLANGAVATLQIVATVDAAGTITNTASVDSADQFDPNTSNNSGGVTINGQSADLQVVKTVDDTAPLQGDTITFTITASNNGPSDATGVEIDDVLPAEVTYVSSNATQGSYDDATGVWSVGTLAATGAAATATLTIVATVDSVDGFVNTAVVGASDQPDPVPSNNSSSVSVNPGASANLAIVKTAPAEVASGAQISYTLLISNAGPSAADGATYSDAVPTAVSNVSASCGSPTGGATCAAPAVSGNTVSGSVPNLPSGGSVTITITGDAPVGAATIENTASIEPPPGTVDPDPSDNSSTADTDIGAAADIAVAKVVDDASPSVGDTVTFTITVSNDGPDEATGVTIDDPLPAGLNFVSATAAQGTYDQGTGTWTIGTIANGDSVTLQIVATVETDAGVVNTATYPGGDTPDPNPLNDSASAAVGAVAVADLVVVKNGPASVSAGGTVAYTITVVNNGPSAASAVVVDDPTPAGLVFAGNSGDCITAYPCTFATLAVGDSVTITSSYSVPIDYAGANPLTNTATVTADTQDPVASNNSSSVATEVVIVAPMSADLAVSKSGPASVAAGATIHYTLLVTNNGPDAVPDAVLEDPTPAGLVFVSASAPCSGGFPCMLGALASGGSASVTVDYSVPSGYAGGPVVNTARVGSASVPDPDPANDASTVTTTVIAGGGGSEVRPVPVDARWMLVLLGSLLACAGVASTRRRRD